MAISIITSPPAFSGLHAPIWHVVLSSNVLQPDFRYIFVIKIGGVPVATLKVLPYDTALYHGQIDVSRILRSYIRSYFDLSGTTPFIIRTNAHVVEYDVEYKEEYGGSITSGGIADTSHTAYNAYAGDTPQDTADTPSEDYTSVHWLTDRPMVNDKSLVPVNFPKHDIRMPRNGNFFISYQNTPSYAIEVYLREVDEDGALMGGADFVLGPLTMLQNGLLVLNLNLEWINAAAWSTPTPLPTNAAGYKLFIYDGTDQTDTIFVRWLCEPRVPATPLHFLNRLGGFDTYYFQGPTRRSLELEKRNFEKIGMVKDLGVTPREYTAATQVYADTTVQYHTKHNWTRKLSTTYLDDDTHNFLWQLIASPQVYLEIDGWYYPVTIKTNNWNERLNRFDRMFTLDLEITMGRAVRSQSR